MELIVKPLEKAFPGAAHDSPQHRASALAHAGRDYLQLCAFIRYEEPLRFASFTLMLPSMHQALEMLAKAVAFKAIPAFTKTAARKTYSHRVRKLIQENAGQVPVFAELANDADFVKLADVLEQSYLGVRYGECVQYVNMGEVYPRFEAACIMLLDDVHARTGLKFLPKHHESTLTDAVHARSGTADP